MTKILPSNGPTIPVCIAGERRCPPEDVGGPSGDQDFLDVISQPGQEEFAHLRNWAGGTFFAEQFDLKAVNGVFQRMRSPAKRRK